MRYISQKEINNMGKFIDLTNMTFGKLKVLSKSHKDKYGVWYWNCICSCGNECVKRGYNLRDGRVKSCGCLEEENRQMLHKLNTTHHKTSTPLYKVWKGMRRRCSDTKDKRYHKYGGRGIKVCPEWQASFSTFEEWALSNGYAPTLSIDRIDNDGNYCPDNCRFVTLKENNRNNSITKLDKVKVRAIRNLYCQGGVRQIELAERFGVTQQTISKVVNSKAWI